MHDTTRLLRWEATAHRLLEGTPDRAPTMPTCTPSRGPLRAATHSLRRRTSSCGPRENGRKVA